VSETAHADSITELAERLVPLAEAATLELLRDALARQVRLEVDRQIGRLLGAPLDRPAGGEERAG
jgi:hypothetical protein